MSASPKQPLVVRMLELVRAEHGNPLPGAGEQALRTAVCKFIATVAETYAHRDLQREEDAEWTRMRSTPSTDTTQTGRH